MLDDLANVITDKLLFRNVRKNVTYENTVKEIRKRTEEQDEYYKVSVEQAIIKCYKDSCKL